MNRIQHHFPEQTLTMLKHPNTTTLTEFLKTNPGDWVWNQAETLDPKPEI